MWNRRLPQHTNTFQGQQQLVIMLACCIVLFISLGSSLVYESISFNRDSRTRLSALADIIAADISAALAFNDYQAIEKTLQILEADPTITQLFVLNAQGKVAGSYDRRNRQQMPHNVEQRLQHIQHEVSHPFFDFSPEIRRPIIHDGVYLGSILVELDSAVFIRKLLASGGIGMMILFLSVLGSYQLAKKLGQIVTDPVQSLATTIGEVTRTKNYRVRTEVRGVTELALLSEGFNGMLDVIAQRDEALQESEYRWKFAIEGAGDGVWDWNIQTDEAKYSRRWKEMLGYAEGDILPTNQEWVDRIHPADQSYVAGAMHAYLEGKTATYVVEYRLRCKDDSYKWILGRGMVVSRGEDGKPLRMIGTHTDLTDRKKHETEQLKIEKLESLGILAGGIAHDFNNILTGIMGNISFAQMFLDPSHKSYKLLAEAEKASVRASELAKQLLTFARGGEPVKKVVSLQQLVNETVSLVLRGSNVVGIVQIPDSIHAIEADEGQISQACNNLIINAMQAMHGGGELTVSAQNEALGDDNPLALPPGTYVRLTFADQGCGIAEEDLKKIFDPYFTTKLAGIGLGLASTHSIISRHGGLIGVTSTAGKGTTFTIHLPSIGQTYAKYQTDSGTQTAGVHAGGAILVMDDEEMIRGMATNMLEYLGYQVATCENGAEAITQYKAARESSAPFAAVILDLTIPGGMGGKETAEQILATDPNACLIVSSGYSNDPIMADYGTYGFCGAVAKPYNITEFGQLLSRLLSPR
jgi:PAS domain S-box-containing protein